MTGYTPLTYNYLFSAAGLLLILLSSAESRSTPPISRTSRIPEVRCADNCDSCSATGSYLCDMGGCARGYVNNPYARDSSDQCIVANINCETYCSTCSEERCYKCSDSYGIYPSKLSTCAPCSTGCESGCEKRGAGKCDSSCIQPFQFSANGYTCIRPAFSGNIIPVVIVPNQGVLKGGTLVTFTFNQEDLSPISQTDEPAWVYFDGITNPIGIDEGTITPQLFRIETPPAIFPGDYPIYFQVNDTFFDARKSFRYLPPPTYAGISPLRHFVSGGTTLNVTGVNLLGAESYTLLLTVHLEIDGQSTIYSTAEATCDNSQAASGNILCIMPELKLPGRFQQSLVGKATSSRLRSRSVDKNSASATYTSDSGSEVAIVKIAICADGNCDIQEDPVVWVPNPSIEDGGEIKIKIGSRKEVTIKGERLLNGAQRADYLVSVGVDECRLQLTDRCWLAAISDESIIVSMPLSEPGERVDNECTSGIDMTVSLGRPEYLGIRYACVVYETDSDINIYIIIGACIGGGLILLAILITVICWVCISSRKKKRERKLKEQQKKEEERRRKTSDRTKQKPKSNYKTRIDVEEGVGHNYTTRVHVGRDNERDTRTNNNGTAGRSTQNRHSSRRGNK